VGHRTREIGIRVALGARPAQVLWVVLREGLRVVCVGLPLGVVLAVAAGRLLSTYIYGVSPTDIRTFVAIAMLLGSVAILACYLPARSALSVDPVQTLKRG
jgi:putative ABC transport system permease protein